MPAMDSVIRAHRAALLSYTTRLTRDRYLAEDVVQETWLRAWRHQNRLTEDFGSVRAWLFRVAHNVAIDMHRNRRARPTEVDIPSDELDQVAAIPDPGDEVENRLLVGSILDDLTECHRDTLVAVYFADRTANSAANVLGIPVGTVKSRVHHALRTLRDRLNMPQAA